MEWNQDAINAARATLQRANDAVGAISAKAAQMESLFVLLAYCSIVDDVPAQHRENVCMLGAEIAAEIRTAAARLA